MKVVNSFLKLCSFSVVNNHFMFTYLTISGRRPGNYEPMYDYRLVITEPEAANCFTTTFQVFTNNNRQTSIKSHFKFITVRKSTKQKVLVIGQ